MVFPKFFLLQKSFHHIFIKFSCALQSLPTNVIVQTYLFIVSQRISKHFKPIGFFHPFLFFFISVSNFVIR